MHDHSTKVRGHSYSLIYSFLHCADISFAIFKAVYLWKCCSYISYAISMTIWSVSPHPAELGSQETTWFKHTIVSLVINPGRKKWKMQNSTVIHASTSIFDILFPNLYLHLLESFLIKYCFLWKDVGLVLVCRDSATITFTSSQL